jgi:hypothetical protein
MLVGVATDRAGTAQIRFQTEPTCVPYVSRISIEL